MEFKKITLEHAAVMRDFFSRHHLAIADLTVAGTVMWREFFKTEYAVSHGCLILSAETEAGRVFYFPAGDSPEKAAEELICERRKKGLDTVFTGVRENQLDFFKNYSVEITEERSLFDYVYRAEDLAMLSGRGYAGQRNHINAFLKNNTYEYRKISSENTHNVKAFLENTVRASYADNRDISPLAKAEDAACREVLDNWNEYGFIGGVILSEGRIIGAAIGDVIDDTLYVHIERADSSIRGAYQLTVREFAAHNIDTGIKYINREDDAGVPGLRTAKLAYHPCHMAEKYSVTVFSK